jgi:hypothetical protein
MRRNTAVESPAPVVVSPPGSWQRLDPELEWLARWMDSAFEIPGTRIRFGLDALIGLVPGLGDLVTMLVSLYILNAARRYGVARITLARMAMNVGIDLVLGAIPFVGDVGDVFWKANEKNVALLRRHLNSTPEELRRSRSGDWLFVAGLLAGLFVLLAACIAATYFAVVWLVQLFG